MDVKFNYKKQKFSLRFIWLDIVRYIIAPQIWLYQRPKYYYEDKEAIKKLKDPFIILSNHVAFSDCLFVYYPFLRKRIWFIVTNEMYEKNAFLSWFSKRFLLVPTDPKGSSFNTLRTMMDIIKEGNVVGIFPEGHINVNSSETKSFSAGGAFLAMQSAVDVVNLYREKRKHWWQRQRIIVGKPYNPKLMAGPHPTRTDVDRVNKEVYNNEILLKETYQNIVPAKKCVRNNVQVFVSPIMEGISKKISYAPIMEEINLCKSEKAKLEKYSAWLLLEATLRDEYGANINKIGLHKLENGKWDSDKYHFSISHSASLVVVAISSFKVGVDIQKVKCTDYNDRLKEMTCNEEERSKIDNIDEFIKTWSLKEAMYKMEGIGNFIPKSINVNEIKNFETKKIVFNNVDYYLSVVGKYKDIISFHLRSQDILVK